MSDTRDWFEVDEVRRQFDVAVHFNSQIFRLYTRSLLKTMPLESPLEAIFIVWWNEMSTRAESVFQLEAQAEVTVDFQRYRLDFRVVPNLLTCSLFALDESRLPKIAIEVDGHAFHEKTREQVAYRNARDRALQRDGWKVFHYSWSELTTDPLRCVEEVWFYADQHFKRAVTDLAAPIRSTSADTL